MKISELICALQSIIDEDGDLPIRAVSMNGDVDRVFDCHAAFTCVEDNAGVKRKWAELYIGE